MAFSNHDVKPDTPINNFATWKTDFPVRGTISEGNLKFSSTGLGVIRKAVSTFTLPNSGTYYWELYEEGTVPNFSRVSFGICDANLGSERALKNESDYMLFTSPNADFHGYSKRFNVGNPSFFVNGAAVGTFSTDYTVNYGSGGVISFYVNMDSNEFTIGRNGAEYTTYSFTRNYDIFYTIFTELYHGNEVGMSSHTLSQIANFGQDPTFAGNLIPTKVYTDSNGQGRFYYEPPAGALALCSRNIDNPKNIPTTYIVDETNTKMLTYNGNTKISKFSPYEADGYSIFSSFQNNYVKFTNIGQFTGDFCIETWIYFHEMPAGNSVFVDYNGSTYFAFNIASTNFDIYMDSASADYVGPHNLKLNQWNHIAMTRSGSTVGIWANGKRIGTLSKNGPYGYTSSSSGFPRAGGGGSDSTCYFADYRIIKGESVYDPANATYTVPSSPLSSTVNSTGATIHLKPSSKKFIDSSSSPVTLSYVGTPSIEAWSPYTSIDNQTGFELPATTNGGSFYFDGTGDYLTTTISGGTGSGDFTIELWAYTTNLHNYVNWFGNTRGSTGFNIGTDASGAIVWYSMHNGSSARQIDYAAGLKNNAWYHIAFVRSSGVITLYLDGVSVATYSSSIDYSDSTFEISRGTVSGEEHEGYISDFRFVKGKAVYTDNFTPPSGKLGLTQSAGTNISAITSGETKLLLQPFQQKSSVNSSVFNIADSYNKGEANTEIINDGDTKVVDFSPYKGGSHGSFAFDGGSDAGFLLPSSGANLDLGTGQFTFEAWIYFKKVTENNAIIDDNTAFEIYTRSNPSLRDYSVYNRVGGSALINSGSANTGDINKWTHIALSRDSSNNLRFYINGVNTGSTTSTTSFNFQSGRIGSNYNKSGENFDGFMTDIRMIKGQAIYSGTTSFTPPAFPLRTDKYSTDGSDPSGGSNITGNIAFLFQPGKVAVTDNEAAKDPDANFKAVTYSGTNPNANTISIGFKPDLVWAKSRTQTYGHMLYDTVRGQKHLNSDNADAQVADTQLTFHATDGFTVSASSGELNDATGAPNNFVAWCWKAGGAPTSDDSSVSGSAMIDGSPTTVDSIKGSATIIPNKMSINTKAGFSIIEYSGTGSSGTLPHGLLKAPEWIVIKNYEATNSWAVYHKSLGAGKQILLNDVGQDSSDTQGFPSVPTNNFINLGTGASMDTNQTSSISSTTPNHICYAWHSVPGYSAFGSYTANGDANYNPFVYTGFEPAWLMIRSHDGGNRGWMIWDNKRVATIISPNIPAGKNPAKSWLNAQGTTVDTGNSTITLYGDVDILSNGFKIRNNNGNFGLSGENHLYMAFAEFPFSYARGV